ncbi:MAG: hypothetical protein KKC29_10490 [Alphaproteobacteria bacterium]|jgi:hypothetical protein|nr:hypothetical protein [Alphaproteobacteria bacterium]MBU2040968.1 hypothetical protein [Alphaproteobacteria bacterium]MBU2126218.1 hypothetical protein [Alphaproteobacteria bacterium]MBU2207398.1 hypothetical protein [Alphaproteobacteria bacterium]MBU2291514.1 hypothetical protein [Alphaproteobacteria bacterium]
MKKTLAAVAAGALLVASQAMATTQASSRVADRVGPQAGESSELAGGVAPGLIFAAVTVASFAIFFAAADDDSESD